MSKLELFDKDVFDTLNIYGFTLNSYIEEFVFIITERHNIMKRLNKKVVRTSGIQISTTPALNILDEFHQESNVEMQSGKETVGSKDKIINLSDMD